jgi:parallel beta-helix repeat protein
VVVHRSTQRVGSPFRAMPLLLAILASAISPLPMKGVQVEGPSSTTEAQQTSGSLSLQELVDSCDEGETVALPAGEFSGPLIISKSLSIVGSGPDQTVITAPGSAPAIVTAAGEASITVVIEDVQIRGAAGDESGDDSTERGACHGLLATGQGHLVLRSVVIRDASGHGVYLEGRWYGLIEDSTIQGNRECGILLERSSSATITRSLISGNGEDGIRMEHTASALIEHNRIVENDEHGIVLGDLARAMVELNLIRGNHEDGVHITGGARAELFFNEIVGNSRYGVFSQSAENLEACEGSRVEDNRKADYSPGAAAACP